MPPLDHETKQGLHKFHTLYQALRNDNENKVFEILGDEINKETLLEPCNYTVNEDTLLHVAIYSNLGQESVIKIFDKLTPDTDCVIKRRNKLGDTILHEAARTNKSSLAMKLIEKHVELFFIKNNYGEIPLFKAVQGHYPDTFRCLLAPEMIRYSNDYCETLSRKDGDTILHQAILNESFDMALEIIKCYPNLVNRRNNYNLIGLQLLSTITSTFLSKRNYGLLEKLIYYYIGLPKDDDDNNETDKQDKSKVSSVKQGSYLSFVKEIPIVKRIKKEKRNHHYASILAKRLIKEDLSWDKDDKNNIPLDKIAYEFQPILKEDDYQSDEDAEKEKKGEILKFSPILVATSRGIEEIVNEILEIYPQAIDVVSPIQQNIFHIAIKHRHLKIFDKIKDHKMSSERLTRRIDKNGNSILHLVGNISYATATELAPAFQLKEELEWYERVEKITPEQYKEFKYKNKPTPWHYFESKHQEMLKTAQEWVKRTSESCSTVAVLIATVAFAAAYTVPGGSDEAGSPILIGQLFFMIFTITDVLALASSLTAVVMFLSILTSPFAITEFRKSLPYKLHIGFGFLFFSVAMTMLSFAATIILIVQLKKGWLTMVVYSIAFLPLSVLALLQIPIFLMFDNILQKVPKMTKKIYTLIMLKLSFNLY